MKYTICVPCYMLYHGQEGENEDEALEIFHMRRGEASLEAEGTLDIEDHWDFAFIPEE